MTIKIEKVIDALNNNELCFCIKTQEYWKKNYNNYLCSRNNNFKDFNVRMGFTFVEASSDWEIITEINPCIFCKNDMDRFNDLFHCQKEKCQYRIGIEDIKKHNEIYDTLYRKIKSEE